uniref:Putative ovule protein n=1 Tax=Solanum chacoense TaxID=4108 RepID=A0A0V0HH77_SOLCH
MPSQNQTNKLKRREYLLCNTAWSCTVVLSPECCSVMLCYSTVSILGSLTTHLWFKIWQFLLQSSITFPFLIVWLFSPSLPLL